MIILNNNEELNYEYIKNSILDLEHHYILFNLEKAKLLAKNKSISELKQDFLYKFHKPSVLIHNYFNFYLNKIKHLLKNKGKATIIKHDHDLHLKLSDFFNNYGKKETEIKLNSKNIRFLEEDFSIAFKTVFETNNLSKRRLFLINHYIELANRIQPLIEQVYQLDKKYGFQKHDYIRYLSSINTIKLQENLNLRFKIHTRNQKVNKQDILHRATSIKRDIEQYGFKINIEEFLKNILFISHPIEYRFYKMVGRERIEMNLGNFLIIHNGTFTEIENKVRKDRSDSLDIKCFKAPLFFIDLLKHYNRLQIDPLKNLDVYFLQEDVSMVFLSDIQDFVNFVYSQRKENDILNYQLAIEKVKLRKQLNDF